MTYALWTNVLINYKSFTRLWGWGFHARSSQRPEEGKGKKKLLEGQSELQPHWIDPSWPLCEKWMGQRPVSDKESQETSLTMSDCLTGDPPAGRRERQSSRTASNSKSRLDRSQLFILGSWCGWRCQVSTHPCPCVLLALQHSLLLQFLLFNKATLFEKKGA